MRLLVIGTTLLALAACGPANKATNEHAAMNEAAVNAAAAVNEAAAVNYVAEVENLSETGKRGVFLGAIRDANISCRDVTTIERLADDHGMPVWRAQCDQGEQHLIQIQPNGTARVTSRATP